MTREEVDSRLFHLLERKSYTQNQNIIMCCLTVYDALRSTPAPTAAPEKCAKCGYPLIGDPSLWAAASGGGRICLPCQIPGTQKPAPVVPPDDSAMVEKVMKALQQSDGYAEAAHAAISAMRDAGWGPRKTDPEVRDQVARIIYDQYGPSPNEGENWSRDTADRILELIGRKS